MIMAAFCVGTAVKSVPEDVTTEENRTEIPAAELLETEKQAAGISGAANAAGISETEDSVMEVHFIDVGQGDSTLIINGEHAMLIDAGDNNKGTTVQLYLQKADVEKLDYLILTHTDADHIGGADVILTKFPVETVFIGDFPKDNATYRDVMDALEYQNLTYSVPQVGSTYSLGDASFTILAPNGTYDTPNNSSIALIVEKGNRRFLFTGDAEEEAERDILANGISIEADVYKAGHHGSRTASTEELLDAVKPEFAVISCGENNDYGIPHEQTMERLKERNIQVYRTDEQGSIVAFCDGEQITWSDEAVKEVTYVCNTNSLKFHLPSCESAAKIAERNKLEVTMNRDEVVAMGYTPCGICEP